MHEADRYALINDASSVAENIILYCPDDSCPDHPTSWSPPAGYSTVKLDAAMPPVNPGDIYDGKTFTSPPQELEVTDPPTTPTETTPITDDTTQATPVEEPIRSELTVE